MSIVEICTNMIGRDVTRSTSPLQKARRDGVAFVQLTRFMYLVLLYSCTIPLVYVPHQSIAIHFVHVGPSPRQPQLQQSVSVPLRNNE